MLVSSMSENPSVPVGDRMRCFFAGAAAMGGAAGVVTFGAGETETGISKTGAGRKPLSFMYFSTSLRNEKVEFKDGIHFNLFFAIFSRLIYTLSKLCHAAPLLVFHLSSAGTTRAGIERLDHNHV